MIELHQVRKLLEPESAEITSIDSDSDTALIQRLKDLLSECRSAIREDDVEFRVEPKYLPTSIEIVAGERTIACLLERFPELTIE